MLSSRSYANKVQNNGDNVTARPDHQAYWIGNNKDAEGCSNHRCISVARNTQYEQGQGEPIIERHYEK